MQLRELMEGISYRRLQGEEEQQISGITEQSGQVQAGMLFCCLKGHHTDGHELAVQAAKQGAVALLVEKPLSDVLPGVVILQVQDTRKVWGRVAAAFYGHPANKMNLIGVTGTKGKTSVTYMIQQMLQTMGMLCGIIGTNGAFYEGQSWEVQHTTPSPVRLQQILYEMEKAGCEVVVMEVSSIGLKEGRLQGMIFDYGIFTNFAPDHIGGMEHASLEEYFYWKKQLFWQCKCGILNEAEPMARKLYQEALEEGEGTKKTEQISTVSHMEEGKYVPDDWIWYEVHTEENQEQPQATWMAKNNQYDGFAIRPIYDSFGIGTSFTVAVPEGGKAQVNLPLPGTFNVANALCAIACAWECWKDMQKRIRQDGVWEKHMQQESRDCISNWQGEVYLEQMVHALKDVQIPGRMELAGTWNGATILVDYAHNASGLEQALMALRQYVKGRIICVFGCGGNRSRLRRSQMGEVSDRLADWTILTEDNSREEAVEEIIADIVQGMQHLERCQIIPDRAEAIGAAMTMAKPGDVVLIAGKGHEAYQERKGVRTHFSDQETVGTWMQFHVSAEEKSGGGRTEDPVL